MKLVNNLIKNTTPKNASSNDPFWEKSEIARTRRSFCTCSMKLPRRSKTLKWSCI